MRRSKKNLGRISRFESLESRSLLAGNVSAAVDGGGNLVIDGDAASNAIQLAQIGANTWKVTGLATTVNGNHTFIAQGVTSSIGTFMSQGNNTVQFLGGNVAGGINFDGDQGNDVLLLSNLTVSRVVDIEAGNGTNVITIDNCRIGDGLEILEGDNNDAVVVSRTNISGGMLVELGNGTNALSMVNVTVVGSVVDHTIQQFQDGFDIPDCGAIILGGSGVDVIAMTGVKIDCFTQIDTLGGNDSVVIANSRFGNLTAADPGLQPTIAADDPLLIDPSLNDIYVGLYIETGTGSDAVTIANTTVYGHLHVDTSNQLDASGMILDATNLKDGNDSVTLAKVTVLYDGIDPSDESFLDSGELWVDTGNQSDAVALSAVVADGDTLIATTDFDSPPTNLDGADSVAVVNSTFGRLDPTFVEFGIHRFSGSFFYGLAITTGNGNDAITLANIKVTEATVIETGDGSDHVAVSGLTETPHPTYYSTIYIDLQGGKYNTLAIVNSSAENAEFYADDHNGNTLVKVHNHFNTEIESGFDTIVG
jgi:hypothetical protein